MLKTVPMNNDTFRNSFKIEALELLSSLEASLLKLEETPDDMELVASVFRYMHTIKGSGAMFGFNRIAKFTHDIETVFDKVRHKELKITRDLIGITLSACDEIHKMIDIEEEDNYEGNYEGLSASFKQIFSSEVIPPLEITVKENKILNTYKINFSPDINIFKNGTDPILLLEELKELGECEVRSNNNKIPCLESYDPDLCYTSWDITLETFSEIEEIKSIFIFVEDSSSIDINLIESKEIPQLSGEKQKTSPENGKKNGSDKENKDNHNANIRVASDKLDKLMDLIGELVIAQGELTDTANSLNNLRLKTIVKKVENLTVELRDTTLNIRMVPIGTIFGKYKRLVRDLSMDLGKEIELITEGEETELDKTVIERLKDPLVHLIRNCIDHGIEPPDIRKIKGKPEQGNIHLSALQAEGKVMIKIKDDGAGLDTDNIYMKAVEKGLIPQGKELTEKEIFNLIMLPGFSTAKEITNISGRGVGMDVVKQGIEALNGTIEIWSEKGKGTVITLKLPLTLAIIDGLFARIGQEFFVFPLSLVERHINLTDKDIEKAHGRHIIKIGDEIVPYIRLDDIFDIESEKKSVKEVVITRVNGFRAGFVVDKVIGNQQTVIKTMGKMFQKLKGISGATIMGNGTVALILDIHYLIDQEEAMEKAA